MVRFKLTAPSRTYRGRGHALRSMAEASPNPRGSTPSVPPRRPLNLDDEPHTPAVSSPLNPDFVPSRARRPPPREQREKKESLKKREAKGVENARGGTPDSQGHGKKAKRATDAESVLSPIKYKLPAPIETDFDPPKAPVFTPALETANRQFYESSEHVYNRKGFRYTHCIADPAFPSSQYHRQTETAPHTARFNFEDASSHILFDGLGTSLTTEKGFRMARANVGVREGKWYYECKILSGVRDVNQLASNPAGQDDSGGHVRMGWARREASLDTPVGFDAYSYGLRDVAGQKVHMSRPKDFMPPGESIYEGDVVGLEISLPSLSLHRKVVEGSYNKAVDVADDVEPPSAGTADIIRDRVPIRYKSQLYFEQFEYHPTKELEELMNPSPTLSTTLTPAPASNTTLPPSPNHPLPPLRTLPFSSITIYKNGQLVGQPFTDLLAFLPPASKPLNQVGAREGLDDGMLGYFPAVSVFRNGAAEVNFGPDFWFPPPGLVPSNASAEDDDDVDMIGEATAASAKQAPSSSSLASSGRVRAACERFAEQIAEDVVFDIIDEIDCWAQDGGDLKGVGEQKSGGWGGDGGRAEEVAVAAVGVEGEIKEIVQEEE